MTAANADPAELAKFSALASRWWDPSSEFKPLHDINPLRLDYIDRLAGLSGKRVLDVGCGGGILAESMARRGASVLGIDLADKALQVAALHRRESEAGGAVLDLEYRLIETERLAAESPASFDCVTCLEMLEHVPEPAGVIAACARLVKPGGWVFFSTINRNPKAFLFAIVGAEYLLGLLPRGTHEYRRFIPPAELAAMARTANLVIMDTAGLAYNPLDKSYRLNRDVSVNYLLACRLPDPS